MHQRSKLSLVTAALSVAAIACSRDAPPTAPDDVPVAELALERELPSATRVASSDPADPLDDAIQRLLPALGARDGARDALRARLLRLRAQPTDSTARVALIRALDAIERSISDADRPDLDALRLQVEGSGPQ